MYFFFKTNEKFFDHLAEWNCSGIRHDFLFKMLFVQALTADIPKLAHEKNNKLASINKLSAPLSVGIDGLWIN